VFEAFSTAYMVMVFEQGQSYEEWLKRLGRPPTQEELDRIAGPILDALEMMHGESFLHRDIAPDNIIVRADGTPVLLDFGAARRAVAEESRSLTGIVKAGYSPPEQYATDGRLQGPWTDIYAFGAMLYRAVTAKVPEEATLRVTDDRLAPAADAAMGTYRSGPTAIDTCLKVRPSERQSVAQLRPSPLLGTSTPRVSLRRKMGETRAGAIRSEDQTMVGCHRGALVARISGDSCTRWDAEARKVEPKPAHG
jgi:serine/threonine protein kinase